MVDVIIAGILLIIIGAAILYIVKAKKSGARCIGCPDSGSCGHGQREAGGCARSCGNCSGKCAGCGRSGIDAEGKIN